MRAHSHFFARWDDGKERFNCEGTNRGMVEPYRRTDEYYRDWPTPLTDEDMRDGYYLQNMTPNALLAEFLFMRGDVLTRHGFHTPAIECFMESHRRAPKINEYSQRMVEALKLVNSELQLLNQNASISLVLAHNSSDLMAEVDGMSEYSEQIHKLQSLKSRLTELQPKPATVTP